MEDEGEVSGGVEGDIRSLFYWSRSAFYILVGASGLWVALGLYRLYTGLTWAERDSWTGSTVAGSDIAWGIAYLAASVLTFLLARWLRDDIVSVFGSRRFQVPRERLLVYSMLALPFGFVLAGVLLVFVNVKLSHPEFLPSHAEAYPEGMPGWVLAVPTEVEEAEEGVVEAIGEEEAPAPEDALMEAPQTDLPPLDFEPRPAAPPPFPMAAPVEGAPVAGAPPQLAAVGPAVAPVAALVEPVEEDIPEVVAVVAGPPGLEEMQPPPVPAGATVEAVVEEVTPEEGEGFTFEPVAEGTEESTAVVEEPPAGERRPDRRRDLKEAHEERLSRLLGR